MMKLRLVAQPGSIRTGRHWAVEQARAGGASGDATRVIELLTSELVTNAVKYGPPGGEITVTIDREPGALGVAVTDQSEQVPVNRHPGPREPGGRGLGLVEMLSQAWGVRVHPRRGKSVWFRVPV